MRTVAWARVPAEKNGIHPPESLQCFPLFVKALISNEGRVLCFSQIITALMRTAVLPESSTWWSFKLLKLPINLVSSRSLCLIPIFHFLTWRRNLSQTLLQSVVSLFSSETFHSLFSKIQNNICIIFPELAPNFAYPSQDTSSSLCSRHPELQMHLSTRKSLLCLCSVSSQLEYPYLFPLFLRFPLRSEPFVSADMQDLQ